MLTPDGISDSIKKFQERDITENEDYLVLLQQRDILEKKLLDRRFLAKQLQLLYHQLDKTHNYQEFVDVLMNNRELLRNIFTLEGHLKRSKYSVNLDVEIDWQKFGLDIMEYITNDDKLLALYNDGLL
ncbi:hypothetical protein Kpol_1028p27 [Vanderwaltozyma polyspora DSM 70294]|uniref:Uncharacterized protein n=1 Tax=Vanderwaltozyma polyspora (strain ATCC 22028 / DSM 70294 / BCRC 21397 / CBS 2163 / NBRC 10782 / NRRL Y-8283 / UCD 57-17) TaxID=436907 RepID=A7TFZ7_VANPO|nr:uncharacterized protein Kpol_1028p27 [Vanderwaltozyma polyspora DSM 70294]EDO18754.1 hypothetical protein Kpol_1028p27 [Vanderwaltozyma polyspora DSM 70294]